MGMVMQVKNELLQDIKSRVIEAGGGIGNPVYLKNISYFETRKSDSGSGNFYINCLFLNDEEEVCADLYRTCSSGFFDFICGKRILDLGDRGLREVLYALENNLWSVEKDVDKKSNENKFLFKFPFKLPSIIKGI